MNNVPKTTRDLFASGRELAITILNCEITTNEAKIAQYRNGIEILESLNNHYRTSISSAEQQLKVARSPERVVLQEPAYVSQPFPPCATLIHTIYRPLLVMGVHPVLIATAGKFLMKVGPVIAGT